MKRISQKDFIKSLDIIGIDAIEILYIIPTNKNKEKECLLYVIREFYDYLLFCGYSQKETHKLFVAIITKYGNLNYREIMQVLYNAMTSCREDDKMSIDERLMYIDGLWFTSLYYAAYRSYLKDYDVDDIVKILENTLEKNQGFFLTEKEKEYMTLGIISGSIIIDEIEKGKQKKL